MAAPAIPLSAIGYVNADWVSFYGANFDADEVNAALMWPQSLRTYDQMAREDSQVAAVMRAVTLPIRRVAYRVDPAGASADAVRLVAEDLGLPVNGADPAAYPARKSPFSWTEHLRMALFELRYGHMFFERVYELVDGQARLFRLSPRMPRSIASIRVARTGDLVSIEQWAPIGAPSMSVVIPSARLVSYVNEMEGANWHGTSLLRSAYKHWLIKDRLIRVQAQSIDRNGMGVPIYTGAEDEADLTTGMRLAQGFRAGDNSGGAIPFGAKLDLMGVTGTVPNAMEPINYHDQQIARAMLAHFLNLGTQSSSATGSYNLGSQFADFFAMSLQTIADHVCDVVTRSVIADLVAVNFGDAAPSPRLICDDIGTQHDATAQAIQLLVNSGAIEPDRALEQFLRLRFGLPPSTPSDPMPIRSTTVKPTDTPPATAVQPPAVGDLSKEAS